jgi:hypothetical protein
VHVTLLLADFAQVAEGKLSVLGAGWTFKGIGTPMALGIILEVPWSETNKPHPWNMRLVDADGQPVQITTPEGDQPLYFEGQFEIGRPPGHPVGVPFNVAMAVNFGPIPLKPGERFTFVFEVDGQPADNGQLSFSTLALPPGVTFPA